MTAPPSAAVTLRSIAPSVFLPATVSEIGNGAIAPVIAITALDLGASPSKAGYLLALLGIGQIPGEVPSSAFADRVGDRRAMLTAAGVAVLALFSCLLVPSLLVLGLALLVIGTCNATFYLAWQSYLSEVAPVVLRARTMSTLGGAHRIGLFIGPFVSAAAISLTSLRAAYAVARHGTVLSRGQGDGPVRPAHGRAALRAHHRGVDDGASVDRRVLTLTLVATLTSFGNGIGSAIMMTLGADVAPANSRIRFLSIWQVMSDSGNAAGPVVVSAVATVWSLASGVVAIGSAGLLAAAGLTTWAPKYSPYATRAMVRGRRQVGDGDAETTPRRPRSLTPCRSQTSGRRASVC